MMDLKESRIECDFLRCHIRSGHDKMSKIKRSSKNNERVFISYSIIYIYIYIYTFRYIICRVFRVINS
jgi:hypothetical protein